MIGIFAPTTLLSLSYLLFISFLSLTCNSLDLLIKFTIYLSPYQWLDLERDEHYTCLLSILSALSLCWGVCLPVAHLKLTCGHVTSMFMGENYREGIPLQHEHILCLINRWIASCLCLLVSHLPVQGES